MKKVIIAGITGSIGQSSLEIILEHASRQLFSVVGLSAHTKKETLLESAHKIKSIQDLHSDFKQNIALALTGFKTLQEINNDKISFAGEEGLISMIKESDADIVVNGIAGFAGLKPSIATLESGKDLALANKESMVAAGPLLKRLAKENNTKIIPVDSEHSAIFHLLENRPPEDIAEIILTASGGAFRELTREQLKSVTLEDALKHPNWDMGAKITIDSASMANKGLEVLEAHELFDIPTEKIKVLIHPQSYVHSLIRTTDQALYAQIGHPDMKLPIQNALTYPDLKPVASCFLNLDGKQLDFLTPPKGKYKLLDLAYTALEKQGGLPIAYNAANEVAVALFMGKKIKFLDIELITEITMAQFPLRSTNTLEEVLAADKEARVLATKVAEKL